MSVIFSVISYKGAPPAAALSGKIDQAGGSLGRSPENQFVLPDPEKFVSRKHATIGWRDGHFFYTDASAGGTYFVNRDLLLQHDTLALADGEVLRVGEYEMTVQIEAAPAVDSPFGLDPFGATAVNPALSSEAAPVIPPFWDSQPGGAPAALLDPFSAPPEPLRPTIFETAPPPGPSFVNQPDVSPFHGNFAPPEVSPSGASHQHSSLGDFDPAELLKDLDWDTPSGSVGHSSADTWEPPKDLFKDWEPIQPGPASAPPADDPFAMFAPEPAKLEAAPVNRVPAIDPDAVGFAAAPQTEGDEFPFKAGFPESHATRLIESPASTKSQDGLVTGFPVNPPDPVQPPSGPLNLTDSVTRPIPVPAANPQPAPVQEPVAAPPAPVLKKPSADTVVPQPGVSSGRAVSDHALLAEFLKGAGFADTEWIKGEDPAAIMATVGSLLQEFVDGMIAVLRVRAEIKSQMRVSVTTMRAVSNNPLKFTVTAQDALKVMLSGAHPGFMDPLEAVRNGFQDLMNHQLATTAGTQAALTAGLKEFDPQRIEKQVPDSLLGQKKARCWDAYVKAYPELLEQTVQNFFGDEFAETYERQMRSLQAQSPNKTN